MTELVSATTIAPVLRALRANGIAVPELLASAGLPASLETDPRAMLAHLDAARVWQLAMQAADDPAFGLRVPELMGSDPDDVSEWAFRSALTLRDAYQRLARHRSLLHAVSSLRFEAEPGRATLTHRLQRGVLPRPVTDYIAAGCILWARQTTGVRIAPIEVRLAGPAPASDRAYTAFFAAPVTFGHDHTALVMADDALAMRQSDVSPDLGRNVRRHLLDLSHDVAEDSRCDERILAALLFELPSGLPSNQKLAMRTGLGAAAIGAALDQCGGLSRIVGVLRKQLAERLSTEARIAPAEVSFLLGLDHDEHASLSP